MLQKALFVILAVIVAAGPASAADVPVQATLAMEAGVAAVDSAATAEDLGKAVEHFQKAASIAPNWPDARYNLGKVLALMPEQAPEAIKELQTFLTLSPQAAEAESVKGEIAALEKRITLLQKQGTILKEFKLAQLKDGIYVVDLNGSIRFSRPRGQFINGLQRGDKIETVNGHATKNMSIDEFYSAIETGSPDEHICFVRLRGGTDPLELSLKRENLYKGVEAFRAFQTPCPK
jgi:tetratricopeptide (TPR) repeat protein